MDPDADERETNRLEAFSDGVFAFAITLLVLDLAVPHAKDFRSVPEVLGALRSEAPAYFSLVLTFATVYVLWSAHHALFQRIHHVNGFLLVSNGVVLLLISTCAFPTAFLAEYLGEEADHLAAAVYAGYFLLVNLAFHLVLAAVARVHHRSEHGFSDLEVRRMRRRMLTGTGIYGVAVAIAFLSAWATVILCAVFWTYLAWRVFRQNTRHRAPRGVVRSQVQ